MSGQSQSNTDFYQLLGITPDAKPEQIQAAYQKVIQQFHPEQLPAETPTYLRRSAEERFSLIRTAYETLSDPVQRSAYDNNHQETTWSLNHATSQTATPDPKPAPALLAAKPTQTQTAVTTTQASPQFPWSYMVISGLAGSAVTLTILSVLSLWTQPPSSQSLAEAHSTPAPAIDPSDAVTTLDPPPTEVESLVISATPTPFVPTTEKIEQFVEAQLQINPVLQDTEQKLATATTETNRQAIEQEFETEAARLIQETGLTIEEYQQISYIARQDPALQVAISAVTQTLRPQP